MKRSEFRDKRPVDELSIEELERILAIRKREARMARAQRYARERRVAPLETIDPDNGVLPPDDEIGAVPPESPADSAAPATPTTAAPVANASSAADAQADDIEAVEVKPDYYEGAPRFEDEANRPRPAPRPRERAPRQPMVYPATSQVSSTSVPPRAPTAPRPRSRRVVWWNRTLLGVEIAATIGVFVLIAYLFEMFQAIQQSTAAEQAAARATQEAAYVPPTPTPIINVSSVVLPTGHVLLANGEAEFNFEEVPVQYRQQVKSLMAQPRQRPQPRPEGPIRIRIAAIRVDSNVVYGTDHEALKQGVGHQEATANPGQPGNMVLAAHNDVYGEIFKDLDRLKPGDTVVVSTVSREYTYVVQNTNIVQPTDTWVMDPSNDQRLTLISCYPYRRNDKRIIVVALLQG